MGSVTLLKTISVVGVMLATLVAFAPAAWLGDMLQAQGPVRLVDAAGTIWRGSAMIAISDGQRSRLIPGRMSWRIEWPRLLAGEVAVCLRHPAVNAPLRVAFDGHALQVQPGEASAPAALLSVLGAPFNTLRPGGALHVAWDVLSIRGEGFAGRVQVEWADAQSALSPVAPLGTFRVVALGRGARGEARVTTLKGPLMIEGRGSLENGKMRFSGIAQAQPEMRAGLSGLIGVLGPRSGDRALLSWELE